MLTKITIKNFKRFENVEVPLGDGIVFIGPNNSGKTSALEALALWHAGLLEWKNKRMSGNDDREIPAKRPGITINRKIWFWCRLRIPICCGTTAKLCERTMFVAASN